VFDRRLQSAEEFAGFIKSPDPKERLNEFMVKRKWEAYLKSKEPQVDPPQKKRRGFYTSADFISVTTFNFILKIVLLKNLIKLLRNIYIQFTRIVYWVNIVDIE